MCAPVEFGGFFKEIQLNQDPITCKFWQVLSIYRQNNAHVCARVYYTDSPRDKQKYGLNFTGCKSSVAFVLRSRITVGKVARAMQNPCAIEIVLIEPVLSF